MKVTWIPEDEYATLYESAEWQREDDLAAARGIVNGLLLVGGFWVMVFCVWAWVKVARYF